MAHYTGSPKSQLKMSHFGPGETTEKMRATEIGNHNLLRFVECSHLENMFEPGWNISGAKLVAI